MDSLTLIAVASILTAGFAVGVGAIEGDRWEGEVRVVHRQKLWSTDHNGRFTFDLER